MGSIVSKFTVPDCSPTLSYSGMLGTGEEIYFEFESSLDRFEYVIVAVFMHLP